MYYRQTTTFAEKKETLSRSSGQGRRIGKDTYQSLDLSVLIPDSFSLAISF